MMPTDGSLASVIVAPDLAPALATAIVFVSLAVAASGGILLALGALFGRLPVSDQESTHHVAVGS
jgi:hypothetical protein